MSNLTSIENLSPDPITLPGSIGGAVLNNLETIEVLFDFDIVANALIQASLISKVALKTVQFQGDGQAKNNIIGKARNININDGNDIIILDDINVLGLTNFSLIVNNSADSIGNIIDVVLWSSTPSNTAGVNPI